VGDCELVAVLYETASYCELSPPFELKRKHPGGAPANASLSVYADQLKPVWMAAAAAPLAVTFLQSEEPTSSYPPAAHVAPEV